MRRLSFVLWARKDWTDLEVAAWFGAVRASRSVMHLVCSYGVRDSRAWISCLLKW